MPTPAIGQVAPAAPAPAQDARFQSLLSRARNLPKTAVVPAVETIRRDTLPDNLQAPLKRAVLVVPEGLGPGAKLAVEDLSKYMEAVTGLPALRVTTKPGQPLRLPPEAAGATVIALGQGQAVPGLTPPASGKAEGYGLMGREATLGGRKVQLVGVTGDDQLGLQYGIYRLMELSGKRFYSYTDTYTPRRGTAVVPANGYNETHAPTEQMKTRGFAPHLYHPIPLSTAFHEPSPEHLRMVEDYIDWLVETGQNYVLFPMLELDQGNPLIPITTGDKNFNAWLPHAKAIVEYAHQRGVEVAISPAFANYVSSNVYAINPVTATVQSFRLDSAWKKVVEARQAVAAAEARVKAATLKDVPRLGAELNRLKVKAAQAEANHQKLLDKLGGADRARIEKLVDQLMQVPWDEVMWELGTSEFTPTNDDLTIRWMNDAVAIMKEKYPNTRSTARSHIPTHPYSEKYQEQYFNLIRFADPEMGMMIHTTHAYGLTDKAPVYGNDNFTHKLKLIADATPEREEIYYPEDSYWVAHDVSVPLFLPVYMLNRKHDMAVIKDVKGLDGEVGFTTAWEWGYWLNDYALARMQNHPEENLTQILDAALAPLGPEREPMVTLLNECMLFQQEYLLDKNLIRHLQGFDALTDFGRTLSQNPVLGKFIKGTNSTPNRLRPAEIMKMDMKALDAFAEGELAELGTVERKFDEFARRAEAMRQGVPAEAEKYLDELADGLAVNALRAKQVRACLEAAVLARKAELTGMSGYRTRGEAKLKEAEETTTAAMARIRDREQDYREAPEYNYAEGSTLTLWGDHYLTPVHTGKYWQNTLEEIEKLYD